jgi:4-hydroxybenzoate polyprenyltransferase
MVNGRPYRWLAVLPGLAMLIGAPLTSGSRVYVLGLPLMLAWIVGCVLVTSATLALIERLDRRRDAEEARRRDSGTEREPR